VSPFFVLSNKNHPRMSSVYSRTMEIELQTLTPLWTGGVETGKVDRIRETGILGSLRWWFEILVRGVGGMVNDPSADNNGGLDLDKYKKLADNKKLDPASLREAGLCDVSQIFGATNWKRRFRLDIVDSTKHEKEENVHKEIALVEYKYFNKYRNKNVPPKWWFPEHDEDKPRSGKLTIKVISLSSDFNPEIIGGLVQFIANWGALGARTQMGFGVVAPATENPIDTRPLYDHLMGLKGSPADETLPSLKNMFFAKIRTKNGTIFSEKDPFILKYHLRQMFAQYRGSHDKNEEKAEKRVRHFIMGTTEKPNISAKINMSRPYKSLDDADSIIRLWGWIPEASQEYQSPWNREKAKNMIYNYLKKNYDLQINDWKEFQHPLVPAKPKDMAKFLSELLCIEEESK
jgi:CRISPR-associated protein Cmr1